MDTEKKNRKPDLRGDEDFGADELPQIYHDGQEQEFDWLSVLIDLMAIIQESNFRPTGFNCEGRTKQMIQVKSGKEMAVSGRR